MTATDTIFALSSAAGRAAVAIIRLSGPACAGVLTRMVGGLPSPRELVLRTIRHPVSGEVLDRGMAVWLPSPRSVTGEDCAEFHLHGSPAVVTTILAALSSQPGIRPAEPGEFTRRAFLNDKMDLVEVEGLADLLEARTASQRRQAYRQMAGLASGVFDRWRQQLLLIRADIEAAVDFADEAGVAGEAIAGIDGRTRNLLSEISEAVARSSSAEMVRDGVRVVLAGRPNTGKSSLLNVLARREVAIVSELPGTTRDAIDVFLDIEGVAVVLTDTAGLREEAADKVEAEGIRRTLNHIDGADVVVWVWSSDVPGSEVAERNEVPDLVIRNKCDQDLGLLRNGTEDGRLAVSTHTGEGIPEFIEGLSKLLRHRFADVESSLIVSARQNAVARNSIRHLNDALLTSSEQLELKAEEIRRASEEIGRLTGKVGVEEWLGAIFSRFCIGK